MKRFRKDLLFNFLLSNPSGMDRIQLRFLHEMDEDFHSWQKNPEGKWEEEKDIPPLAKPLKPFELEWKRNPSGDTLIINLFNKSNVWQWGVLLYYSRHFDTSQSKILGEQILAQLKMAWNVNLEFGRILRTSFIQTEHARRLNQSLRNQLKSQIREETAFKNRLIDQLLLKVAKPGERWLLDEDARETLINFRGDWWKLDKVIQEAMEIPRMIQSNTSGHFLLSAFHLDLNRIKERTMDESQISARMQRSADFLERYEKAAEMVKKEGLSLSGKNIGSFCQPPISAAAISDCLRKHRIRIADLLSKYPERWTILRHEFRPIKKIMARAAED